MMMIHNECITQLFFIVANKIGKKHAVKNLAKWVDSSKRRNNVETSVATGSEFPVPGRFRVLQSRVRAGYGYTLKFETRVPGTLRVIGG